MARIKVKVGFRYEYEGIIEDAPENWKEKLTAREAEVREYIKKELDFDLASENNPGVMSDWIFEAEGIAEEMKNLPSAKSEQKTGGWIKVNGFCIPGGDPVVMYKLW